MGQKCGSCQDCTGKDKCGYTENYGCFNSCADCFGEVCDPGSDDPSAAGCAAYFPESAGVACIGKASCSVQVSGYGQSAEWVFPTGNVPVANQTGVPYCHGVNYMAKLKVLAVCS